MSRANGIPGGFASLAGGDSRSVASAAEFLATPEPSGSDDSSDDEAGSGVSALGGLARGRDVVVIGTGQLAMECVVAAMGQGASTVLAVPAAPDASGAGAYATGALERDPETGAVCGVHVRQAEPAEADAADGQPVAARDETIPASLVVVASAFAGSGRSAYDAHAKESASGAMSLPFDSSGSVLVVEGAVFEDADAPQE